MALLRKVVFALRLQSSLTAVEAIWSLCIDILIVDSKFKFSESNLTSKSFKVTTFIFSPDLSSEHQTTFLLIWSLHIHVY